MDTSARRAGIFLICTALATVVAVFGRVSADADLSTLEESVAAISESQLLYGIGGTGRLVSGLTLILAAWFLLDTWIIKERFATPLVPVLFVLSGAFTTVSGGAAVMLAFESANPVDTTTEIVETIRWLTGKAGFTAAGLALIVAARYQWKVGGVLTKIAPGSLLLGTAMQFIWVDTGTGIHAVIGIIFFLWLMAVGSMLASGTTEKIFVTKFGR